MARELIGRAGAGDGDAFRDLTEPYRRELQVHCYRMLGSFQDAEDALQDTLLTAWRGLDGFEGRASIRTWLYRIATNQCLNARRAASRRPAKAWDIPGVVPPAPSRLGEIGWLEPFPDALLAGGVDAAVGPEAHYEQTEAISLAFVTALQVLPARQRAVLILREVLGFRASEVASMLETTVESVNSALKRARATLDRRLALDGERRPAPAPGSREEQHLTDAFVRAYEAADVDALVALLTRDVGVSMPPIANEYVGREAAAAFYASIIRQGRTYRFVTTRANGQPALGAYLPGADGRLVAAGLAVLTLAGDRIAAVTRFESGVMGWFGLPAVLEMG